MVLDVEVRFGEGGVDIVTAVKGLFRVRPLASERLDRGAMTEVLGTLEITWTACSKEAWPLFSDRTNATPVYLTGAVWVQFFGQL